MLAFSMWNAIWLVLITYLFVTVLFMLFAVIVDLFRDHDLSAVAKAVWIVVLVLLPLLGLIVYVISRGQGMAERSLREHAKTKETFDSYVRDVAGGGAASELEKAAAMHASGSLNDSEYAALKAKILS